MEQSLSDAGLSGYTVDCDGDMVEVVLTLRNPKAMGKAGKRLRNLARSAQELYGVEFRFFSERAAR